MQYPKPFMSITELVQITGLSRDFFKNLTRAKDAPIIKTGEVVKSILKQQN